MARTARTSIQAPEAPEGVEAVSPQAAFLMSDILAGNTDPSQNSWWARTLAIRNGPDGQRRPAAAKTGTADNRRDFSTYGYLRAPEESRRARHRRSASGWATATTRRRRRASRPHP